MKTRAETPPRQPAVGIWLLGVCVCVFAMVLAGGATRLTDSGLSITEWDLGKGMTPPLTDARWAEEFALYQRTTEYQVQNTGMSLAEFQSIYWWEWGHRFLGKMIGVVFALPFLGFALTGRLRGRFWPVLGLFALGALQGAIGWWMVTSGLWSGLDVSPYRLAVHLGLAFLILALALWLALEALGWPQPRHRAPTFQWASISLIAIMFVQIVLGAVMAGADGGRAYADWPTIGGELWPRGAFNGALGENHATQQLLHRTLGYIVGLAAIGVGLAAATRGERQTRLIGAVPASLAAAQVALGVAAIVTGPHLGLSLAHQANAALLWLSVVAFARAG
jgi:cytochrome c oxidase assembly protein subunit 15